MKLNQTKPAILSRRHGTRILQRLGVGAILPACLAWIALTPSLTAGESKSFKEEIIVVEEVAPFSAELSTGWDSLYMFRGVNVIRGDKEYGSSLYWTDLNATWNMTASDSITVGAWMAFGLDSSDYKELDVYVGYTKTIGDFSLGMGYIFYDAIAGPLYSHELNWSLAYTINLPKGITITPALIYYLNLGPDAGGGQGIAETGSSFLQARIDAGIPIYKDIVSLEPWVAFGASFGYNFREDGSTLTGANNLELGLGVPVKVNDTITLYAYAAYSNQWSSLVGTEPSTFWGGAKVSFSF
jgi:hypothetical protein